VVDDTEIPERSRELLELILSEYKNSPVLPNKPDVSVIVPVFGSPIETLKCVHSLVTSNNRLQFEIVIIDDASKDPHTPQALKLLEQNGIIRLITHTRNLGFPSACNTGFQATAARDVVIINSDVEVYGDWLDRLSAPLADRDNIATISPLTSDGEICSYPVWLKHNDVSSDLAARIDCVTARANENFLVESPTAVGHCTYITRAALNAVGGFDVDLFGRGYGEENYFSQVAQAHGMVNLIHAGVYVRHIGAASFGSVKMARVQVVMQTIDQVTPTYLSQVSKFISANPLNEARARIDAVLLREMYPHGSRLLVGHSLGGGTERALREEAQSLATRGICPLIARGSDASGDGMSITITHAESDIGANLGTYTLPSDADAFIELMSEFSVQEVSVHHFIDFDAQFPDHFISVLESAGITFTLKLHDYFLMCPRISLSGANNRFCGTPGPTACQSCLRRDGDWQGNDVDIHAWLDRSRRILSHAADVTAPSLDAVSRLNGANLGTKVRLDTNLFTSHVSPVPTSLPSASGVPKVLVIGAISSDKGALLLRDAAQWAWNNKKELAFEVIGYTVVDNELEQLPNVVVRGRYKEAELPRLIQESGATLVWFPALWPETFSYTLSAAIEATASPMLSFDIGAIAHRIRTEGVGWTVPLTHSLSAETVVNDLVYYTSEAILSTFLERKSAAKVFTPSDSPEEVSQ
jgi:GT2 family glycosyltransferase